MSDVEEEPVMDYPPPSDDYLQELEERYGGNMTSEQTTFLRKNVWSGSGWACYQKLWTQQTQEGYCDWVWDEFYCWPSSPPNTTLYKQCPNDPQPLLMHGIIGCTPQAIRVCNASGMWEGDSTHFDQCLNENFTSSLPDNCTQSNPYMVAQTYIYFYGCLISLVVLSVTMFIFCFFKSLQCSRVTIHKHLVMSFILRFFITVLITGSILTETAQEIRKSAFVCRGIVTLTYYMILANIFWMFVEGFFLHNRVAVSVFSQDTSFRTFYFIGWVVPGVFVSIWVIVTYYTDKTHCWTAALSSLTFLLLAVPVGLALSINTIFLLNIIRILVTKLRANNTMETAQIRKAVRATAVLFPLLGVTNLVYFFQPSDASSLQNHIYRITNAILQPLQGVLVSVVYCFLNGEVQAAIRKYLQRRSILRLGHARNRRPSSRTSSLILSQTEVRTHFIRRHGNGDSNHGNGHGNLRSVFSRRQKCRSDPAIATKKAEDPRKPSYVQIRSLQKSSSSHTLRGLCNCRFHRLVSSRSFRSDTSRSNSVSRNESVETNMSDICL